MKSVIEVGRTQLKWLAILAMTLDHTAYAFLNDDWLLYFWMRVIGRLTAPIMSYFLVEGFCHTRNFRNYLHRLLLFALIAQPFYFVLIKRRISVSFEDCILCLNVLFTLSISLVMLKIMSRSDWKISSRIILLLPCFMLSDLCDWSYIIPAWVLIFYLFRKQNLKRNLIFLFVSAVLLPYRYLPDYDSFLNFSYHYGVLLSLIPIHFHNQRNENSTRKKSSTLSKWFFYLYYPLHIAVIVLIRSVLG